MSLTTLQDHFVENIPAMQHVARFHFRKLPPKAREEAIHNAIALAWKFFHGLFRKGRQGEPGILNSCLRYAVKQTKAGRRIEGMSRAKDALDCRRSGRVRFEEFDLNQFVGRNTPIPDHVSFRVDIPAFFDTLNDRQRRMAMDLAWGMTTTEAAEKYSLSPGRISQCRREFKTLFDAFFAE